MLLNRVLLHHGYMNNYGCVEDIVSKRLLISTAQEENDYNLQTSKI